MKLHPAWAEYAQIQAKSQRTASIEQSHFNDVRLDFILSRVIEHNVYDSSDIERAVSSFARKQRRHAKTIQALANVFAPTALPNPEEVLFWQRSWANFTRVLGGEDVRVLCRSETTRHSSPARGSERTRLSRLRNSPAFRAMKVDLFGRAQ